MALVLCVGAVQSAPEKNPPRSVHEQAFFDATVKLMASAGCPVISVLEGGYNTRAGTLDGY